jgi:hypothetical protein
MSLTTRAGDLPASYFSSLQRLIALGVGWQTISTAGVAALTALPTTTAGLSLFNNETAITGKCYIIHSFGSVEEVIDATQADTTAIFAMNNLAPATVQTDGGQIKKSLSGALAYPGVARVTAAATVTNDGWFPHGRTAPMAPAVAGANWKTNEVIVDGLYMVPPQGCFNVVAVKAGAAAALQQFYFIRWLEVQEPFL